MTFTNKILWYSLIVAHLRLIDTHIHTDSISLSCPSRDSPIGPCHLKKNEEDREVWKCCLDPAIMPTVKSLVCVCVWITFCLPACLLAQIVRPSCLSACVCACVLTVSSFAKETSLWRPPARRHSSPRCQNVVSSKQSDDIPSVIQTARTESHRI